MDKNEIKLKERNASVELIKIIALLLIIVNHCTQTVSLASNDYIGEISSINIRNSTWDCDVLTLVMFRFFGAIGNATFVGASAWFMCDISTTSLSKVLKLIFDTFIISVISFAINISFSMSIDSNILLKSFLPTTFQGCWFIGCYVLLYLFHYPINLIIQNSSQKTLALISLVLFILYSVISTIYGELFYNSYLILFITIYFIVAYIKKYINNVRSKLAKRMIIIGIVGMLLQIVVTNIAGMICELFNGMMLHWSQNSNPFTILLALGMVICATGRYWNNKSINKISSISVLVYVIHENYAFRSIGRPLLWIFLTDYIRVSLVLGTILFSSFIAVSSFVLAFVYKNTFSNITNYLANKLEDEFAWIGNRIVSEILKLS